MDECLLCMDLIEELKDCIKVNSTQWQDLNVENLIEKYLWCISPLKSTSYLCAICWQELFDFHKFYVRIANVHSNIGNLVKTEIGTEEQLDEKCIFVKEQYKEIEKCNDLFPIAPDGQQQLKTEILIIKEENLIDDIGNEDEDDNLPLNIRRKRKCTNKNIKHQMEDTNNKDPLKKSKIKESSIKPIILTKTLSKDEKQAESIKLEISDKPDIPTKSNNKNDDDKEASSHSDPESTCHSENTKPHTTRHKYDDFIAENIQISCNLCQIPIENFSAIIKHFHVEHKQRGYIMCCKRKFFDRTELIDHLHVHRNPDHFKCNDCGKVLADRFCLRLHIKKIHERYENKFDCDICGKALATKQGLKVHQHVMHEVKDDERLPCAECDKTFRNKVSLSQHIKTVHLKKYIKICDLCGKHIIEKDKFERHMLEHEGKPVPTVACNICGRRYTDKRSLRRHMNLQHPIEKTEFNCSICFKQFANKVSLKMHIKTVHELSYVNKCTICGKSFKRPDALRDHMSRHAGTPLHACTWCPKKFYSNGQMHAHRKEAHPKEWEHLQREKFSGNLPPKYSSSSVAELEKL